MSTDRWHLDLSLAWTCHLTLNGQKQCNNSISTQLSQLINVGAHAESPRTTQSSHLKTKTTLPQPLNNMLLRLDWFSVLDTRWAGRRTSSKPHAASTLTKALHQCMCHVSWWSCVTMNLLSLMQHPHWQRLYINTCVMCHDGHVSRWSCVQMIMLHVNQLLFPRLTGHYIVTRPKGRQILQLANAKHSEAPHSMTIIPAPIHKPSNAQNSTQGMTHLTRIWATQNLYHMRSQAGSFDHSTGNATLLGILSLQNEGPWPLTQPYAMCHAFKVNNLSLLVDQQKACVM